MLEVPLMPILTATAGFLSQVKMVPVMPLVFAIACLLMTNRQNNVINYAVFITIS